MSLQVKWDKTDEKPAVVAITTAAFVGVWALSGIVDRIDKLPIIGGLLELVGLVVTSWFVYRYLVFGPDRQAPCPASLQYIIVFARPTLQTILHVGFGCYALH